MERPIDLTPPSGPPLKLEFGAVTLPPTLDRPSAELPAF